MANVAAVPKQDRDVELLFGRNQEPANKQEEAV